MTTTTLLEKAREGRRAALASLESGARRAEENVLSIFDFAFDGHPTDRRAPPSNVIAFRSARRSLPAPTQEERLAA